MKYFFNVFVGDILDVFSARSEDDWGIKFQLLGVKK